MKKITSIFLGVMLVAGISYFLWDRSSTQTFEEVTEDMLAENESVEQAVITNRVMHSRDYSKEAVLDEDLYESMIAEAAGLNLRKQQGSPGIDYVIMFETDQGSRHYIDTNEADMHVNDHNYRVVGDNHLVNFIEASDLDWE